ncbi:uncharacterized protein OCT59_029179 [Rhizophagus irregularis]|nr:hypothetical protein OCT59_029179 [Rhizophagus irregularis]GET64906.1 hypothetical protein GLOIN_2v1779106 [Rhizophagus irregularis DAOM 181602=DAOM 197198]
MTKELKRKRGKKVIESEGDEGCSGDEGKNKIKKNSKKLKIVTKNMMLENSKDNVFRLGEYDKHKWGYKNNGIVPDLIRL